jgi:hypothetical protein
LRRRHEPPLVTMRNRKRREKYIAPKQQYNNRAEVTDPTRQTMEQLQMVRDLMRREIERTEELGDSKIDDIKSMFEEKFRSMSEALEVAKEAAKDLNVSFKESVAKNENITIKQLDGLQSRFQETIGREAAIEARLSAKIDAVEDRFNRKAAEVLAAQSQLANLQMAQAGRMEGSEAGTHNRQAVAMLNVNVVMMVLEPADRPRVRSGGFHKANPLRGYEQTERARRFASS